jgi:hypothetical protein
MPVFGQAPALAGVVGGFHWLNPTEPLEEQQSGLHCKKNWHS